MRHEIRLAGPADRDAVERIVAEAYEPWVTVIGGRPKPMNADYATLIAERRVYVTGARDALIVLIPEDDALLVENVAVRPAGQGKGIGRWLLAFAEEQARGLGVPALRLYTNVKMLSNIALYEKLGYVETGRENAGVGQIVHLRKPLTPEG